MSVLFTGEAPLGTFITPSIFQVKEIASGNNIRQWHSNNECDLDYIQMKGTGWSHF